MPTTSPIRDVLLLEHHVVMSLFRLSDPVEAICYSKGQNEHAVAEVVKSAGGRQSFSNARGHLDFYNDGPELTVHDGQWVVMVAGKTIVMDDDRFRRHFAPIEG